MNGELGSDGVRIPRLAPLARDDTPSPATRRRHPERSAQRSVEGSVISDPEEVGERIRQLLSTGTVTAVDGSSVELEADSICVHGDSPDAVALATAARDALGLALQ